MVSFTNLKLFSFSTLLPRIVKNLECFIFDLPVTMYQIIVYSYLEPPCFCTPSISYHFPLLFPVSVYLDSLATSLLAICLLHSYSFRLDSVAFFSNYRISLYWSSLSKKLSFSLKMLKFHFHSFNDGLAG